jgi:hypothetical protein
VLATPEPAISVSPDEDVDIQVLGTMALRDLSSALLLRPALANKVQKHQAVLMKIIQEVSKSTPHSN